MARAAANGRRRVKELNDARKLRRDTPIHGDAADDTAPVNEHDGLHKASDSRLQ